MANHTKENKVPLPFKNNKFGYDSFRLNESAFMILVFNL